MMAQRRIYFFYFFLPVHRLSARLPASSLLLLFLRSPVAVLLLLLLLLQEFLFLCSARLYFSFSSSANTHTQSAPLRSVFGSPVWTCCSALLCLVVSLGNTQMKLERMNLEYISLPNSLAHSNFTTAVASALARRLLRLRRRRRLLLRRSSTPTAHSPAERILVDSLAGSIASLWLSLLLQPFFLASPNHCKQHNREQPTTLLYAAAAAAATTNLHLSLLVWPMLLWAGCTAAEVRLPLRLAAEGKT